MDSTILLDPIAKNTKPIQEAVSVILRLHRTVAPVVDRVSDSFAATMWTGAPNRAPVIFLKEERLITEIANTLPNLPHMFLITSTVSS